jgi:outer membrane protein assembly factor BamB
MKKIMSYVILFVLLSSMLTMLSVTGEETESFETYAYIGAVPNPVGIGQDVLLHVGITQQLAFSTEGWTGLTVTVTDPENNTHTLGPFTTDSTGGTGSVFIPDQVGTYYLQTNFPEQTVPSTIRAFGGLMIPEGATMRASHSEELALVVQDSPIPYYPDTPMPSEYWSRPIDAQIREWYTIAGNWLITPTNYYAPYNDEAPDSSHVLWTQQFTSGGTVGGTLGTPYEEAMGYHSYEMGDAYEGKLGGAFGGGTTIIMGGKFYYDKYANPDVLKETVCMDLHTGEQLWSKPLLNNLTITRGQLMYWDTYDYHGVYDYIWATGNAQTRQLLGLPSSAGTTWCAFDPYTGDFVYALYGIPSGTTVYGSKGEILIYSFDLSHGTMMLWNSSNIPQLYASTQYGSMGWGQWRPMGKIQNATEAVTSPTTPTGLAGYTYNKTIPTDLPGSVRAVFPGDKVVGSFYNTTQVTVWALSLKSGQEGMLLYKSTWNAPSAWESGNQYISSGAVSSEDNLYVLWSKEERKYYGFSTDTGKYLWTTPESEYYLQSYVSTVNAIAYGKLFSTGASGIVYCYDAATGDQLWAYEATDDFSEILWANQWWNRIQFITDGKIYVGHEEHSPIDPRPRGAPYICLNATTGDVIWRADGLFRQTHWGGRSIIGDSIIAGQDTYSQRIFAIGKGPSALTISAPDVSIDQDKSVVIKGLITDISPGTSSYEVTSRFPSGVPAVSDESMDDWMVYVYKQFPRPSNATGLQINLSVVDANGNYRDIGTTTSDADGFYSFSWQPDIDGKYTVYASFAGSNSYWPSHAVSAFVVDPAAETPPPTQESSGSSAADLYLLPGIIAIIAVIIIVGVVLLLAVRKRP